MGRGRHQYGLPRMEGEAPVWPPQGWRGRHQYGRPKDGGHQYGPHERGRPLGAFPRMEGEAQYGLPKDGGEGASMAFPRMEGTSMALLEGEGTSIAFPRMEGKAPVRPSQGWWGRRQ